MKPRGSGRGGAERFAGSDEDNDTPDNQSVSSSQSETQSIIIDGENDEVDEISAQEDFEDKLKEVIESLTQKSAKSRSDGLKSLKVAFSKKYICDFLNGRKETVMDSLERCLKKGRGEEQALAAQCMAMALVQFGAGDDCDQLFGSVRPSLLVTLADTTMAPRARAACAETLGIGSFIAGGELEQVLGIMAALEKVFRASYLKGDQSVPNHTPDVAAMHNSSLAAWTLLLSIAPPSIINAFVDSHLSKVSELLSSPDLDLRITSGETIALIYELAREDDEEFEGDDVEELCASLRRLATDGHKYRAKKDRRQQRANFRDILRAVESDQGPDFRVKFGTECLEIDSWTRKRQYDMLCHLLGSGMNVHLMENDLVRDIFGLGSPIPQGLPIQKDSKTVRHQYNAAAFKARTKARAKFRDKRTVAMAMQAPA